MCYVNLKCRFNRVFNQCFNEKHLPNIHINLKPTRENQREPAAAEFVMRLELGIKVCITVIRCYYVETQI